MTNEKILKLIKEMTLDEKIGMVHGTGLFHTEAVERLEIPALVTSDGPMGVRMDFHDDNWKPIADSGDYTSYLPSNTAVAATWNPDLAKESGKILGKEARGRGKDVILAPGINILRSPLCGRNFEYMGEDPYLVEKLVVPMIKGIEENDVAACVKHFAANNQETKRLEVDVEVGERALREIYLPGFEAAVKEANVKTIMGAYNKLRGQHCCHNSYLLNDVLRKEWGFKGAVISDWGGVHDTVEAAYNGLDVEMSVTDNFNEYYMADPLKEKIIKGEISESVLDEKVEHILTVMNELHMLDGERKEGSYNDPEDRMKLLRTAEESIVLLKNEDKLLPIDKKRTKRILVVGDNANRRQATGGGSAEIKALYEVTPLLGIKAAAGGNLQVLYEAGYDANTSGNIWESPEDGEESGQASSLVDTGKKSIPVIAPEALKRKNEILAEKAVNAAKDADLVIFVGGLNHLHDTEGKDREDLKLPYDQENLIKKIKEVNEQLALVIVAGSPLDLTGIKTDVKAILYTWYAGMEGGNAIGNVLFGKACPSGKLPETFPMDIMDSSAHKLGEFPGDEKVRYNEGIYIGYRYHDTFKITPAYAFGFGLSYTEFKLSDMKLKSEEQIWNWEKEELVLTLKIKNVGNVSGAEVVQLYVHAMDSKIERAYKELKAFQKVTLRPGEEKEIELTLDKKALRYYNAEKSKFCVEGGKYELLIGNSSDNIMLTTNIQVLEGEIS